MSELVSSRFTASDGALLSYYDMGPKDRASVVLVSGYGAPAASWCMQWQPLLDMSCRVVSFDRRSHGLSPHPAEGHSLGRHAEDLHELLLHTCVKKPVLVGQSMGASTIFAYLAAYGDEEISGVVDIDQTPKMVNSGDWPYGMRGLTAETLPTFFNDPIPEPFHVEPDPKTQQALARAMEGLPEFDAAGTLPLLLDHAGADWRATLAATTVPVLFIAGANSPFWPCEHAQAGAALCKNGTSAVIENCGHAVNWEQVDACNKILLSFITGAREGVV